MVAFGVACKHNLSVGTTVKITGTTGYDGSYDVVRLGLDNGDLIDYYFVIDLPPTGIIDGSSRMVRYMVVKILNIILGNLEKLN
jgi:hypothetical protein